MIWARLRWPCLLVLVSSAPVRADPLPEQYTLGRYLPADVWMYIHGVVNPDSEFVYELWSGVGEQVFRSGIIEDFKALLLSTIDDPHDRAEAEEGWSRVRGRISEVNWSGLFNREAAFAERLSAPFPDLILLTRPESGTASSHAAALRSVLVELGALFGRAQVVEHAVHGVSVSTLSDGEGTFGVHLLHDGDVVGLVVGAKSLEQVTGLLAGEGTTCAVIDAPHFRQAIQQVPTPKDSISFFDLGELLRGLQTFPHMTRPPEAHAGQRRGLALLESAIENLNIIEYIVSSESTEGYRQRVSSVIKLHPDAASKPLARALTSRQPFARFDRFIPQRAVGFSVSAGLDLGEIYHGVLDFIEKNVPDGADRLADWEHMQTEWGFHVERDLLSWLGGETISVQLPPSDGQGVRRVMMIRVRDPRLAAQKVNAALDHLGQRIPQLLQGTEPAPEVDADGFQALRILPLQLMLQIEPVCGMYEDWLTVGTSAGAVNECLATSRGAPSIVASKRFQQEGLIPNGPVYAASFSDLTTFGDELGAMAYALGTFSGVVLAQIPEEEAAPKAILAIMIHGFNVLATVDFLSSSSSVTTFDGTSWHVEQLTTYKTPKAEG